METAIYVLLIDIW